jgi:hypothetical protein
MDRRINKNKGIYLVLFNVIRSNKEDIIIYNYIKYNEIFLNCLCAFLMVEQHSSLRFFDHNFGNNYFFILDKDLSYNNNNNISLNYISDYSYKYNEKLKKLYNESNLLPPLSLIDFFKEIIDGQLIIKNKSEISILISSIIKKKSLKNIFECISDLEQQKIKFINYNYKSIYNLINKFVFVVSDLETLKSYLKKLGHNSINEGPQAYRGSINSMNHILITLDRNFRNSMYKHNKKFNNKISKDKFSFSNIHINIGNVR